MGSRRRRPTSATSPLACGGRFVGLRGSVFACARSVVGLRPVGFDVADGFIGGPFDSAWAVVAAGDQVRVVDVDGDRLASVEPAQRDDLAGDHDDAGGGDAALHGDRVGGDPGWWSGGSGSA